MSNRVRPLTYTGLLRAYSNAGLRLVSGPEPAAPPAGEVLLYSATMAGRELAKFIGPTGGGGILQPGLSDRSVMLVSPSNGTVAPSQVGCSLTTATTISHQKTIASANRWLATRRTRHTSAAAISTTTGHRTPYAQWYRGNAPGFGGFWFRGQFGQSVNRDGGQFFYGLCALTTALAGNPTALLNMIGVGYDSTDPSTGNFFLLRNDGAGTATKLDLGVGAARGTTHGYDLIMFCPPDNIGAVYVMITNLHTGTVILDTSVVTDLPALNVGMAYKAEARTGTVASAVSIEVAKTYIEAPF